jgi:hypothetical protein
MTTDKVQDLLSMALVGAFWGCTNPLLRKGSVEAEASSSYSSDSFMYASIKKFFNVRVWLPYVLNQCGSILFYILLAKSDLTMAVPTCNALALVFSCITSFALGEPIHQPIRTIVGASFVVLGVTLCVAPQEGSTDGDGLKKEL